MEPARFSFVLLVIALANLATDITRLVLELAPPRVLHESVSAQTRPQQETSVQEPEGRKPDTTQKDTTQKDTALKEAKPLDAPGARGALREPRESGPARMPLSQLRPDFSINHPPWCSACGQPIRPYVERRRFYGW
jgi:hypothetical protein